jgi:hypothetical protein
MDHGGILISAPDQAAAAAPHQIGEGRARKINGREFAIAQQKWWPTLSGV